MDKKELTMSKIEGINRVAEFDPELLALDKIDLETGEKRKYLPVKAQVAWFWLVYPNGKIDCCLDKVVGDTAYATCRLYADRKDPLEAFIIQQTATFTRINGNSDTYAFVERAQTSAMGRALRFAQFGNQFDYAGDSVPPTFVDPYEDSIPFMLKDEKEIPEHKKIEAAEGTVKQEQLPIPQKEEAKKGKTSVTSIPTTLEEAMNTIVSLPRFSGKTFREVLTDDKNKNLPEWISRNKGYSGLDDATCIAAQIIMQSI